MNTETNVTANREYKSSVFSMLFNDKDKLLTLYNALNNSNYRNKEELSGIKGIYAVHRENPLLHG